MCSYRKAKNKFVMIYVNPITRHSLTRCNEQQHICSDQLNEEPATQIHIQ